MGEWKEYRLGDILSIKSGFSYKGKYIGTGNSLLLGMGCVSFKDKFLMSGARPYSGPYDERYKVHSGDIVLATRQQSDNLPILAMPAMVPDSLKDKDIVIGTNLYKVEITDTTFSSVFIYWLLKTKRYVNYIAGVKTGTTVSMVTKKNVEDFTFFAPTDPKEREEIASIISSLDDKIAVNKKICENLEAQAQALFKHWFVDFAPFKEGKFVESELGLIPKGWRVGKAEDFYTINIGKTPPRAERQWFSESKGNNKIWISISDMGSCGTFISDSKEYLTPEAQSKFNVVMVPVGTILLSFKLTIGRVAIADNELTTNEAIARFILPNSDYREFTYLYLKQYKYESLGSTSSIATAVNSKIIKSMPLLMPPTEVMTKFSAVVGNLFDEIRILSSESLRLSTLRDTLLPKLMSGELKVGDKV